MAIAITAERPKPVFMNKIETEEVVCKIDENLKLVPLSKEELDEELDKAYIEGQKEIARGGGMTVEEAFEKFKRDNSAWFVTA